VSDASALNGEEAERLVARVLQHLLGAQPAKIVPLTGGLTNIVFEACLPGAAFVVRLGAGPGKLADFLKEQWAMSRAAEQGVPVPEVLEVGTEPIGVPYMVSWKVAGTSGTHHPERFRVLHEMGRLARRVHRVRTEGFGHTFDWSNNQLSRKLTWDDYLTREFHCRQRLDVLERHGMLTQHASAVLEATLSEVERWSPEATLNHGDLRLKNVIADEDGAVVALIDWDECTGNAAPSWDLAIALHDLSVDAKEEFLAGYGLTPRETIDAAPVLRLFNVLHYASAVEAAADAEDRATLERLRARLQGALDLYGS
jgi:hygromycin-B 4-O-kinase